MALELRIAGPGFDTVRTLNAGGPELVLGRDTDCGVCLPDPLRNVSRRHLAVWNLAEELHFHVLSVVNGVEMPFGEAPPGAKGVLPPGQTLKLAEYSLTVAVQPTATVPESDPWAVFDTEAVSGGEATRPPWAGAPGAAGTPAPTTPEDDPFGDWGFQTTFGHDAPGGALDAAKLAPAGDLSAFFRGLGVDPERIGPLSQGEFETIGKLVRMAVVGLLELHSASTSDTNHNLRGGDRTMIVPQDSNPLKTEWPDATKLQYLFGGRAAAIGFPAPERALRELLGELQRHDLAATAAARAAIEGTIREFSPAAIKERLLGSGPRLFEGARVWDAYGKHYAEQSAAMPEWSQRLLDRYFGEAYLRESLRIKRETVLRQG
jgi:predicted component of type VI protein secretion system